MARVQILLATYNAGEYLAAQLDSLLAQSYQDWELLVADDGSSDQKTLPVLEHYRLRFPDKVHLLTNPSPGRGATLNFAFLLSQACAPWIMFCDQDDIWLPYKIERSLERALALEKPDPSKPVLVFTDLRVVAEDLRELQPSFMRSQRLRLEYLKGRYAAAVAQSVAPGCSMIFNRAAQQAALPLTHDYFQHDHWLLLNCVRSAGECWFLDEATVLYRQHRRNAVGVPALGLSYFFAKICSLRAYLRRLRLGIEQLPQRPSFLEVLAHKLRISLQRLMPG
jgi:glycosyltransferase involved in cell wall biosynthesis